MELHERRPRDANQLVRSSHIFGSSSDLSLRTLLFCSLLSCLLAHSTLALRVSLSLSENIAISLFISLCQQSGCTHARTSSYYMSSVLHHGPQSPVCHRGPRGQDRLRPPYKYSNALHSFASLLSIPLFSIIPKSVHNNIALN